jgi:hypothetical protein
MSQTYEGGPITVTTVGKTQTTSGTSARVTIPNNSAGELPRYIRVAATAAAYVKIGDSSVVATTNDILVQPADAVIMSVNAQTNIAYIQDTAAGKVNVLPLENV